MTGNLLIIILIAFDHCLHKPMYFFLMNLAVMDLGDISVIVPKSLASTLMNSRAISYSGCVAQVYFYAAFQASDVAFLTIMAHDRYIAICYPFQYESNMHKGAFLQLAACAWITCILYAALHTGGTLANTFCSKIVQLFFCDILKLLKLSCSDLYFAELGLIVLRFSLALGCFVFIIVNYIQIFAMVLKFPSVQGQKNPLHLPSPPHCSFYLLTALLSCARFLTIATSHVDIVLAVVYLILPPMFNPFIYGIRNKEIKMALLKVFNSWWYSNSFLCIGEV